MLVERQVNFSAASEIFGGNLDLISWQSVGNLIIRVASVYNCQNYTNQFN